MRKTLTMLVLGASLAATALPSLAQTAQQDMGAAITMLESSVGRELSRLGISNVDVMRLSLGQLAQIRLILSTDDMDRQQQIAQVQSVVRRN